MQNDIWSLGILVLECLLGSHPYGDAAAASGAVLHSIAGNQPLPLSALRVSAHCRDWLAAALSRDPRQRWTAAQLLEHGWISAELPAGQEAEQDAAAVVLVPGQFGGSRAPAGHADAWDQGWQAFGKQQQEHKQQPRQQQVRRAGSSAPPPPWVESDWVTGLDRLSSQLVAAKAAGSNDVRPQRQQQYAVQGITSWED
jgi:serine/threonine protein kinase